MFQIMADDFCLDVASATSHIKLIRCHGQAGNQAWEIKGARMRHRITGKCLGVDGENREAPILEQCDKEGQMWAFG